MRGCLGAWMLGCVDDTRPRQTKNQILTCFVHFFLNALPRFLFASIVLAHLCLREFVVVWCLAWRKGFRDSTHGQVWGYRCSYHHFQVGLHRSYAFIVYKHMREPEAVAKKRWENQVGENFFCSFPLNVVLITLKNNSRRTQMHQPPFYRPSKQRIFWDICNLCFIQAIDCFLVLKKPFYSESNCSLLVIWYFWKQFN